MAKQNMTIEEMVRIAKSEPNGSFANAFLSEVDSGKMDNIARTQGYDLSPIRPEFKKQTSIPNQFNRLGSQFKDIPQDIIKTGQNISGTFNRGMDKIGNIQDRTMSGEQSLGSGTFQTIGQGLSTGAGIIGDLFIGGASLATTPEEEQIIQDKLVQGVQALGKTDVGQGVAELADQYNAFKEKNPEIAGNLEASLGFAEAVLEITGAGAGIKAAKKAGRSGVTGIANVAGEVLDKTSDVLKNNLSIKGISSPKKDVTQLVKEITQESDPRKLKQNIEVLTSIADDIDPQKGLTVQNLRSQIKDKQSALMESVDSELLKDTKLYNIDELTDSFKGRSGVIKTNPVRDTFAELSEIYTKAKDLKGLDELNFLQNKLDTVGLSKKEINDLARIYNRDAAKGFSKSGEALTSVGAQASENTRKSLKNVARSGLSDNAKELDGIYGKTIQLDKSLNAFERGVNNLQKKAGDRGIIEKLSNDGAKVLNLVTAGGARGFLSGLLQSNVGSKTRNFIALEEALSSNLKLLQQATKPRASQSTIINAIESIAEKLKNFDLPDVETKPFLDTDKAVKDLGKRIKDTPNKQGGFVKTGLDKGSDLIADAKKFDTVDEFVGSFEKRYHQTSKSASKSIEKEGFRLDKRVAGDTDILPVGVNTKKTSEIIGLPSSEKQMEVFFKKDSNIKEFVSRDSLESYLANHPKGNEFKLAKENINKIDKKYQSKINKLEDELDIKYSELYKSKTPISESKEYELIGKKIEDTLNEWTKLSNIERINAQKASTNIVKGEGLDVLIIDNDTGGFGKLTDNTIILDPSAIKTKSQLTEIFNQAKNTN